MRAETEPYKGSMWRVKSFCRFMLRIYSSLRRIAKLNNTIWKWFLRDRSLSSLAPSGLLLKLPSQTNVLPHIGEVAFHSCKVSRKVTFTAGKPLVQSRRKPGCGPSDAAWASPVHQRALQRDFWTIWYILSEVRSGVENQSPLSMLSAFC